MVSSDHYEHDELTFDYDGLAHRVTRLGNIYPMAHCRDVWAPAMKHDQVPAPTHPTCFWCITSRYRP